MNNLYWSDEWPNLNSISLAIDNPPLSLSPMALGALYRIVWHIASKGVHTAYSQAESKLEMLYDTDLICRIVGCSKVEWKAIEASVLEHLILRDGVLRIRHEGSVRLSRATRAAVPSHIHATASARDRGSCVYCGSTVGPLHLDHIWPVSKGGTNEPSNLVTACANCNLSKGSKSLREWMEASK